MQTIPLSSDASVRANGAVTARTHNRPPVGASGARCIDETHGELANATESGVKRGSFLRDVALTMGTEFTVMVFGLVLVSLSGRWLGPTALAEFLLLRRLTAWLISATLLGLATGLPRYVARATANHTRQCNTYFLGASACLMLSSICIGLALMAGRRIFAGWLFGDSHRANLVLALSLMVIGLAAQTAVYGYYRGLLAMVRANTIQVCNLALIPLAVVLVLYRSHSVALMVSTIGCLTVVSAALFAVPIFRRLTRLHLSELAPCVSELLHYGIPRVPGDFGAAALLALGPVVATHYVPMARVSSLLLGLSMLMVTGYAAGPLGVVLLSKVSMMLAQGRMEQVRVRLGHLLVAVPELSVFVCAQLIVFADVVVRIWVGPQFLQDIDVIRLLALAVPPYLFYMALRSTIDAATVKPLNAGNVLVGLMTYFALVGGSVKLLPVKFVLLGIAGSLFVTLVVLAVLTVRTFRRLYGVSLPWGRTAPSLIAAIVLGAVAFVCRWLHNSPITAVQLVLLELGLSFAYLAILAMLGSGWLQYVWNAGLRGRIGWIMRLKPPSTECG